MPYYQSQLLTKVATSQQEICIFSIRFGVQVVMISIREKRKSKVARKSLNIALI